MKCLFFSSLASGLFAAALAEKANLLGLNVLNQDIGSSFAVFDANGDGKVSEVECLQQGAEQYMSQNGLPANDPAVQDWVFDYSNKLSLVFPDVDPGNDGLDKQEFMKWLDSMEEIRGYSAVEQVPEVASSELGEFEAPDDERPEEDEPEEDEDERSFGSAEFAAMDQDQSGAISLDEIKQHAVKEYAGATGLAADDPDLVSWKTEFESSVNANFASCDANADGELNIIELSTLRAKLAS